MFLSIVVFYLTCDSNLKDVHYFAGLSFPEQALIAPDQIPLTFLAQLQSCAKCFKSYQMATITENIRLFDNMTEERQHQIEESRKCCVQEYVERYHMRSIKKNEKICPNPKNVSTQHCKILVSCFMWLNSANQWVLLYIWSKYYVWY